MKTTLSILQNATIFILLVTVSLATKQTHAQTVYTPYAITTFAGKTLATGTNDGIGGAAQFNQPEGVATDNAGVVYVADRGNNTIRKITPDGAVTTLAGTGGQSGSTNGTGSEARFNAPIGLAVDAAGNVYVADSQNHTIRKITPLGEVTTLAGSAGNTGNANGTGSVARFNRPFGVALDGATNIYIADCNNHKIRKITPAGEVSTYAGSGVIGTNDGTTATARFKNPQGLAFDNVTNLIVTDSQNYTVRKITPAGVVTTVAGFGGQFGTNDAVGSAARFSFPNGVAVDSEGYIYVVDQGKATIRRITPSGAVTTLAGKPIVTGSLSGTADGVGSAVRFGQPSGMALDSTGNIYVGDMLFNRIRKGVPALVFDNSQSSLSVSNGILQARLTWPFPTNVVTEASPDLQNWTPIQTNAVTPEGLGLSLPLDTNQNQFFRARLSP
jgi:sugar lactone lactonase YvrE